ncbi:MAG: putative bifunctional diguanylate cyclase/phosphodiesterase [Ferrimicrobium sp.]
MAVLELLSAHLGVPLAVVESDCRWDRLVVDERVGSSNGLDRFVAGASVVDLPTLGPGDGCRIETDEGTFFWAPIEVPGSSSALLVPLMGELCSEGIDLALEVSVALSVPLRVVRYLRGERIHRRRFDAIARLTIDLVDVTIDQAGWLNRVVTESASLVGDASARILMGQNDSYCVVAASERSALPVGARLKRDAGIASVVERTAAPFLAGSMSQGITSDDSAWLLARRKSDEESVVLAPIVGRSGGVDGLLGVFHSDSFRFGDVVVESLEQMASLAAAGLAYRDAHATTRVTRGKARWLAEILERLGDGVAIVDDAGVLVYVNGAFAQLHGAKAAELEGMPGSSLVLPNPQRHSSGVGLSKDSGCAHDQLRRRLDGTTFVGETIERPYEDLDLNFSGSLLTVRDISARIEREGTIRRAAWSDALTGLRNRVGFFADAGEVLDSASEGEWIGLLFVDLDGLKAVNDRFGHTGGDRVLIEVANRISSCLRGEDIVGRIGGDEFAVLLAQVDSQKLARVVANRVASSISESAIALEDEELRVTAAVGVATGRIGEVSLDQLISLADSEMYHDKFSRRRPELLHLGGASLDSVEMELGPDLVRVLRGDLSHGHLFLAYQPVYRIRDRRVVAVEALVRWEHYREGLLPPGRFLPLALQFRLLDRLDEFVRGTAIASFASWGDSDISLSINLSGINAADPHVVRSFVTLAERHGVDPSRIVVELTESELSDVLITRIARTIGRLKAKGFKIALDDFGVGTSSFRHLQIMPVDIVKIDRQFVRRLGNPAARRLVAALAALAGTLEMEVIAEGVQDRATLTVLEELGIEMVQGFLLGKPLREEAFVRLLERQTRGLQVQ